MASILKHLRSSTANKRPTASGLADGQIAINTASGTPALFFKDSASNIVKVGPAHVGSTAPNTSPAGSAGNSTGELWVDNGLTTNGLKYYNGAAFVNLTPSGTTSTIGLVELATDAETQAGTDNVRVVTPSGLQSKVSDSTSTSSSTTIASSTAVKSAYDLADAALPKAGGTITGAVTISPSGSLAFEGSTDDSFETTLAVVDPTADRTITLPNVTGTVITTGDSGTVTSTMIANDTIVDADINSAAAITLTKLGTGALPTTITVASGNIVDGTISNVEISASAAIADTKLDTISTADKVSLSALNIDGGTDIGAALADADLFIVDDGGAGTNRKAAATRITDYAFGKVSGDITITSSGVAAIGSGKVTSTMILDGTILNADVNASAAIAGTKISPDFGSQTVTTTGIFSAALGAQGTPTITFTGDTNTGIYSPGADQVAISTNGTGRLFIDASGNVGAGTSSPTFSAGGGVQAKYATFSAFRATVGANTGTDFAASSDGTGYVYVRDNAGLIFGTSNTERMRLDSSGRLGLGTSSPGAQLDCQTSTTTIANLSSSNVAGGYVTVGKTGTTSIFGSFNAASGGGSAINADALYFRSAYGIGFNSSGGGGVVSAFLDTSGRLGIGTTSPSSPLTINNDGVGFRIERGSAVGFLYHTGTTNSTDLQLQSQGGLNLYTESGNLQPIKFSAAGTEKARIDSSGRLLVGTSTSVAVDSAGTTFNSELQVAGSSASVTIARTVGSGSLFLTRNQTVNDGSPLGFIGFQGGDGTNLIQAASIQGVVDGTPGANDMPGRLVFSTTADGASSPTERMRITQAGLVGINTTTKYDSNNVSLAIGATSPATPVEVQVDLTSDRYMIRFRNGNGFVGAINTNGSATSYNTTSDHRLKENIVPLTGAISRLNQLQVHRFNFIADPDKTVDGFIAHEAQAVVPECVTGTKDEVDADGNPVYQGIDQSKLVPLLTAALQEALAKIEALEARLTAAGI